MYIQGICSCMRTHLLLSSEAVAPKDPPHLLLFLLLWVAFHHVRQGRLVQRQMVFQVLWNNDIRHTLRTAHMYVQHTLGQLHTYRAHLHYTAKTALCIIHHINTLLTTLSMQMCTLATNHTIDESGRQLVTVYMIYIQLRVQYLMVSTNP